MAPFQTERPFIVARDPATPPQGLEKAIVAVGNFDGVHRGHVAVIARAWELARSRGLPCAVLTFEPHPSDYFRGAGTTFRLSPLEDKVELIRQLGVDGMIVLTFDETVARLPAEDFVRRILVERLDVSGVIAGYDFHFGRHRGGSPAFLQDAGLPSGFGLQTLGRVDAGRTGTAQTASSTATRLALQAGDVAQASALLGHLYAISGVVRSGQQLGRTLDFPTANVQADPSCQLRHGIYAVRVEVDGVTRDGVASYGRRPTVDNGAPLLETFIFDFSGDLYGRLMHVAFVGWIRAEEKFESLDALKARMLLDVVEARAILSQAGAS